MVFPVQDPSILQLHFTHDLRILSNCKDSGGSSVDVMHVPVVCISLSQKPVTWPDQCKGN